MKLPGNYPTLLAGAIVMLMLLIAPEALCTQDSSRITDIQVRPLENTVELQVEGAIEYGYFPLSDPERLIFDFPGTILATDQQDLSLEEENSCFRQIDLTQFSAEPPIARLTIYLTRIVTATVNVDPDTGNLLITCDPDADERNLLPSNGNNNDHEVQAEPESGGAANAGPTVLSTPVEPATCFQLDSGESDTIIRFPGIDPAKLDVEQLRFPDRIHIRIFTGEVIDERPRFDALRRGNIWNDVAKQWASYIDRDGYGIVDLTIYTYPNVGYSQYINNTGTPEIRLFTLGQETTPAPGPVVEVASYPEETAPPIGPSFMVQQAPGATSQESIEETEVTAEETGTADTTIVEESVNIVQAVESMEVIENGSLVTDSMGPETEPVQIADNPNPALQSTALPMTIRQDNLLGGQTLPPLYLRVGDVVVIQTEGLIRASLGNPEVATLNVISQEELLLTAMAPGSTTLLTWEDERGYTAREVNVLDATGIREEVIEEVIGDPDISVSIMMSGETESTPGVVLEGTVDTEEERARAGMIASLYAGDRISNLIEVTDPRQVMVKVRVVEIEKRALDEHLSQFSAAARADNDDFTIGIITDLLDPENPGGGLMDSRVRPGIVNGNVQDVIYDPIDAVLNELEQSRQARVLSQPNVVSLSGHLAHFRVGGEVPYTYQNENGVTVVEFKEFGISVDMTPNVDSQRNIMLDIEPVVRTVDMALAIAGIPGFRTREMTTSVQLRPGETLVIGGLIQSEVTRVVSEVPILSEIPVLGELFRSHRFSEDETELVIFLTPYIVEDPAMTLDLSGAPEIEEHATEIE
jgi:pilus assembly protein CpaC